MRVCADQLTRDVAPRTTSAALLALHLALTDGAAEEGADLDNVLCLRDAACAQVETDADGGCRHEAVHGRGEDIEEVHHGSVCCNLDGPQAGCKVANQLQLPLLQRRPDAAWDGLGDIECAPP